MTTRNPIRKLSAVLLLLLLCASVGAQPRSQTEALSVAQGFFAQGTFAQKSRMRQPPRLVAVQGREVAQLSRPMSGVAAEGAEDASFYVFNDEANSGFVIVSGDERQEEVLGYSDEGVFDSDNIPCGLRTFLEQYAREYELLQQGTVPPASLAAVEESDPEASEASARRRAAAVGPLLKTTWGQSPYYNNECPMDPTTNKQCITGCVATAMAQIMNYHQYPSVGQGSTSYTSGKRSLNQSMNFASVQFDWSKMTNSYSSSSTSASVNAVARLMHACGVALHMDYTSSASSSYSSDIPYCLINYFKYPNNARFYKREYHTGQEWEEVIQAELEAKRPIAYSGRSDPDSEGNTGGHAFLLDGYDGNGHYHFNWGWRGTSDGYFALSSLRPTERGYTNYQTMVCFVSPKMTGDKAEPWYADKFEFDASTLQLTITNVWCYSSDAATYHSGFSGFWGWRIQDVETKKSVYRGWNELNNIKTNSGYKKLYQTIDKKDLEEGKSYYLYPVIYNLSKSTSTRIRTLGGKTDYYLLQVKNGKVTATLKGDPDANAVPQVQFVSVTSDNQNLTSLTQNDVLTVRCTFKNTGKTYNVNTQLRIGDKDMKLVTSSGTVTKSMPKDAEVTVVFEYPLKDLSPGEYTATGRFQKTWDNNNWTYSNTELVRFTVKTAPVASTPIVQFVSVTSDNQNLDNLTNSDRLVFRGTFKNTGKTANVNTRFRIWDNDMEPVTVSATKSTQFQKDGQTTVTFEYPLTNIPEGSYIATVQYQKTWDDNKWYYSRDLLTNFVVKDAPNPEIHFVSVTNGNPDLTSLTQGDKLKFHATFMNKGKTGSIRTCIMMWNDSKKYVSSFVTKTFPKDAETQVDIEYPLENVVPDTYTAAVYYERYWEEGPSNWWCNTGMYKTVTVKEYSNPEMQLLSVNSGNTDLEWLSHKDVLVLYGTFKNTGKTANVSTRLRIWDENMQGVASSEYTTQQFPHGQEITVRHEYPLKDLPVGTYLASVQYGDTWDRKAWIYFGSQLKTIVILPDAVGIQGVMADDEDSPKPVYDLRGQRLSQPRKGINVIGGKKVVIK